MGGWSLGNSPTDIGELALTCGFHNRFKAANPGRITIGQTVHGFAATRITLTLHHGSATYCTHAR